MARAIAGQQWGVNRMKSLLCRCWESRRPVGRRVAAGGLIAAALVMLAVAPAEAGNKHKHWKHGHHGRHGHHYGPTYYYAPPRVVYVQPRPVYVAPPPPVIYYEPAPVIYPQPSFNVIIPLDFD